MKKIAMLALCLTALSVANVWAENRSPRMGLKPGVLICETLTQVAEQLSSGKRSLVEGCGFTQDPLYVEIVLEGSLETNGYKFSLVRFEFPVKKESGIEMWVQYGFWSREKIKVSLEIEA